MPTETLDIALVHPEVLGLYGDRGNALALAHRAGARGIRTRVLEVALGDPVPEHADLYVVGGAEDAAMLASYRVLRTRGLAAALAGGAPCLAVCAGFQLLAERFVGPDGTPRAGLGVLDVRCARLDGPRAVGEVTAEPTDGEDLLLGFENHQGDAVLGRDAQPLGLVRTGVGNGHDRQEGAVQGRVIGTYLHGPVLVRNPELADRLLGWALGRSLPPYSDVAVERLRRERRRAVRRLPLRLRPTG